MFFELKETEWYMKNQELLDFFFFLLALCCFVLPEKEWNPEKQHSQIFRKFNKINTEKYVLYGLSLVCPCVLKEEVGKGHWCWGGGEISLGIAWVLCMDIEVTQDVVEHKVKSLSQGLVYS